MCLKIRSILFEYLGQFIWKAGRKKGRNFDNTDKRGLLQMKGHCFELCLTLYIVYQATVCTSFLTCTVQHLLSSLYRGIPHRISLYLRALNQTDGIYDKLQFSTKFSGPINCSAVPSNTPYKIRRGRPRWWQTLHRLATTLCPEKEKKLCMTCDTWHVTCDT